MTLTLNIILNLSRSSDWRNKLPFTRVHKRTRKDNNPNAKWINVVKLTKITSGVFVECWLCARNGGGGRGVDRVRCWATLLVVALLLFLAAARWLVDWGHPSPSAHSPHSPFASIPDSHNNTRTHHIPLHFYKQTRSELFYIFFQEKKERKRLQSLEVESWPSSVKIPAFPAANLWKTSTCVKMEPRRANPSSSSKTRNEFTGTLR